MTTKYDYCSLDHSPCLATDREAWWFREGKWKRVDTADAAWNASVLSKERFERTFGHLPALPRTAFQDGGKETAS